MLSFLNIYNSCIWRVFLLLIGLKYVKANIKISTFLQHGVVKNITVQRLHGERFLDAAIRVSQELRITKGEFGCGDDSYCTAQVIENNMLKSQDSNCGIVSIYAEYHQQFGHIINCHEDTFCLNVKKSYFSDDIDVVVDDGYNENTFILTAEPESPACRKLRLEVVRYPFFITSKSSSVENSQKFFQYQLNRWFDDEDTRNIQVVSGEPPVTFLDAERNWSLEKDGGTPMTTAELSCNWKHYQALEKIVANGDPISIIMEDGISFVGSVSESLRSYMSELDMNNEHWDILFDSDIWDLTPEGPLLNSKRMYFKSPYITTKNCSEEYISKHHKDLNLDGVCIPTIHGASKGANFYVLKLETAKILLQHFHKYPYVIDHKLNFLIRYLNLRSFWAQPPNVRKVRRTSSAISCDHVCKEEKHIDREGSDHISAAATVHHVENGINAVVSKSECETCKRRLSDKMASSIK